MPVMEATLVVVIVKWIWLRWHWKKLRWCSSYCYESNRGKATLNNYYRLIFGLYKIFSQKHVMKVRDKLPFFSTSIFQGGKVVLAVT